MENDIQDYVQNSVTSDDIILTPDNKNQLCWFLLHDVIVRGCCKPLQNYLSIHQNYNKLNPCCKILAENSD